MEYLVSVLDVHSMVRTDPEKMDKATQHWEILKWVPKELVNRVREFMVIGDNGDGVILLTEDGDGYWLGEMRFGEIEVKSKHSIEPIKLDVPNLASMAHGHKHILLLDKSGQIHAMGQNNEGQLGLGTVDQQISFSPQLISIPNKFTSIRCGYWHSVALTEDGKVWAWGGNYWGQVGMLSSTTSSTAKPHPSPHQIAELNPHQVVAVECGSGHSLALTDQGEVYGWGANYRGQLGDGSESSTHIPTKIPSPSPVQSMAASYDHTLLLTQTGEVYACGTNGCGQLGIPIDTKFSASLVKVAGLPSISQIASHFDTYFSIAMSTDQRCFVWGRLKNKPSISTPLQLPPIYSTLHSVLSFYSTLSNTPYSVRVEGPECPQRTDSETETESMTRPIQLGERIARMFDNPDSNPDVKFELGDQSILVHRSVLQITSAYFARFFSESSSHAVPNPPARIPHFNPLRHTTNPSEPDPQINPITTHSQTPLIIIPIPNYSYPTFHAYLHFLYTDSFQVPTEHLTELFNLAHSYLESDLEQLCLTRMRSTISLENCCLYYQITERHSLPEFQQALLQFIADNSFQVYRTEAYQSLNGDLCKKLAISIGNLRR